MARAGLRKHAITLLERIVEQAGRMAAGGGPAIALKDVEAVCGCLRELGLAVAGESLEQRTVAAREAWIDHALAEAVKAGDDPARLVARYGPFPLPLADAAEEAEAAADREAVCLVRARDLGDYAREVRAAVEELGAASDPGQTTGNTSPNLFEDVTLAAKVVVGGSRTSGLSRLVAIARSKEPAGRKLFLMEKTGLLRPDVSSAELAGLLKVTPAAVKKTQWWKTRMARRRSEKAEADATYHRRRRPGQRGRRR